MPSTTLRTDNSANMSGIRSAASPGQLEQVFHYKYAIILHLFKSYVFQNFVTLQILDD